MRNRRNKRKNMNKKDLSKILKTTGIISAVILLFFIFAVINAGNNKIITGVKINGVSISNLNADEAKEKMNEWYENTVLKDICLQYEELEENINVREFEIKNNIDDIITESLRIGRSGNILKDNFAICTTAIFKKNIKINLDINDEKIENKIEEISGKLPGAIVETNYYIENNELIIKKGQNGVTINKEELKDKIYKTIESSEKNIKIPVKQVENKPIDIEKIHEEIFKEAKNAYVEENEKVHAHVNGIDFAISIDEAKKLLEEEKEEYIIPLKVIVAEKTLENLGIQAFPDKISEFTSRYDASNKNRSINLGLASDKINETVILPGETFSYNKIVGARTIQKGYKEAAIYSGGKVVDGIGGGICQLSSTLYNAVLYANLEIKTRSNHRFITSYVPEGRDATVSWGTIDFAFKNNRTYPIKIISIVNNGIVRIQIYGIKEEKEYDVELQTNILEEKDYKTTYINDSTMNEGTESIEQYGVNGVKCETYKIVKFNGQLISKELLSTDTYASLEQVVRKGTKKVENQENIPNEEKQKEEITNMTDIERMTINVNPFVGE